jgi:hypothetical protein
VVIISIICEPRTCEFSGLSFAGLLSVITMSLSEHYRIAVDGLSENGTSDLSANKSVKSSIPGVGCP